MTPIFYIILTLTLAITGFLVIELISNLRRQKKIERLIFAFEEAAAEFGLTISKRVVLGDGIIGLDEAKNKLLFIQLTGNKHEQHLVDLEEVKSCRVNKSYRPFWNGRMKMGVLVQTIALQFTFKNGGRLLLLPFFNNAIDPVFEMRERSEQAIEWQKLLSSRLNKSGKLRPIAFPGKPFYH